MKTLHTKHSGIFVACLFVLMLANCQPNPKDSLLLVTEKQECKLCDYTHVTGEIFPLTINIDIPAEGPEALVENITDFLNEELYDYFDNGMDIIPYESLYSKDASHLIEHYREAYAAFFFAKDSTGYEFPPCCLEIRLAAQTKTYVTFQVDHIFFGEGVEVMTEWTTFGKSDGHRLQEVISDAEMLRFYREHPELRNNDIWENALLDCQEGDAPSGFAGSVGLLNDALAHQYTYAPGIYEDMTYPLDAIAPYLSQEAQELIKDNGSSNFGTE